MLLVNAPGSLSVIPISIKAFISINRSIGKPSLKNGFHGVRDSKPIERIQNQLPSPRRICSIRVHRSKVTELPQLFMNETCFLSICPSLLCVLTSTGGDVSDICGSRKNWSIMTSNLRRSFHRRGVLTSFWSKSFALLQSSIITASYICTVVSPCQINHQRDAHWVTGKQTQDTRGRHMKKEDVFALTSNHSRFRLLCKHYSEQMSSSEICPFDSRLHQHRVVKK